jgi:hypothetical protein
MNNVKTRRHGVDRRREVKRGAEQAPTEIDNMNPNNPGVQILVSIPVSTPVPAHSIITVKGAT